MSLGTAIYVDVTPKLIEALDQRWGGREPRHDLRYVAPREWYVPASEWTQHWGRHPTSYHGYHGLDIRHWRYSRINKEYIALWCESHDDDEHAKLTLEDMKGLLEDLVGPSGFQIISEQLRDQELR